MSTTTTVTTTDLETVAHLSAGFHRCFRTVATYCNGGWDDELRDRHAAEAPMVRP